MAEKPKDYKTIIKKLIALEHDAIAAYHASIERLENTQYKSQLGKFVQDHEQHLAELNKYAQALNIDKNDGPDAKVVLTTGKVILANVLGDEAILGAMKTNEDQTVAAYETACEQENLPDNIRATFEKGFADETRHRAWMQATSNNKSERAA